MRQIGSDFDVVHLNDAVATVFTPFVSVPAVKTLHHPHEPALSDVYMAHRMITYVTISDFQRRQERMPRLRVIPHGIPVERYRFETQKQDYLAFLGRIAPVKGAHLAIEVAKRAGLRLKLAGEIQPIFREYWERDIRPHVDGRQIEYVGEADFAAKNELLAGARALVFPIQWDEPFGLVMVEAMACGTPVLALPVCVPVPMRWSHSSFVASGISLPLNGAKSASSTGLRPEFTDTPASVNENELLPGMLSMAGFQAIAS
jgi:glycosyltransferase involved in cell wall biosynthesis